MHLYIHRLLASTLALLLLGIAPLALADEAAERAALEAATQAWINAFNARDTDALVALATQDVVLMDPSVAAPVSGRDAARGAWAKAVTAAQGHVTTATKEAVIVGNIAWRIGALTHKLPNGDVVSRGQSLEIWQRVNGGWKIHRQMSSGVLAQLKPVPRRLPTEPILDTPD
jgi:ketosteroid isomerase-like protein